MSFVRPLEFAFGIVATGGMVLLLSGSAFAAEGGTSTISQATSVNTTSDLNSTKKVYTEPANAKDVAKASLSGSGSEAQSRDNTPSSVPSEINDSIYTNSDAVSKESLKTSTSTAGAPEAGGTQSATSSKQAYGSNVASTTASTRIDGAANIPVSPADVVSVTATNETIGDIKDEAKSVVFGSQILKVQPNITTSNPMPIVDLASMVPSALALQQNVPNDPVPALPTGLIGRLTAVLAGSVVPSVFFPISLDQAALVVVLTVLSLVAMLSLRPVALTFGAWLHRGGYVHAARSDMAEEPNTTFFATPQDLSYVMASVPIHSSFLMGVRQQTVFPMFPTLTERRR